MMKPVPQQARLAGSPPVVSLALQSGAFQLELERGACYRVIVPAAEVAAAIDAVCAEAAALPLTPDGGLIGNLKIWENVVLPAAWRADARLADLEAKAHDVLDELGFDRGWFARVCGAFPETLSSFEARVVSLVRAVLGAPEVLVCDRLLEGLSRTEAQRAARFPAVFHRHYPFRTVVCIDSPSSAAAGEIPAARRLECGSSGTLQ